MGFCSFPRWLKLITTPSRDRSPRGYRASGIPPIKFKQKSGSRKGGDRKVLVLIVTSEESGVDKYSQELAKRLDIKNIESRRYLSLPKAYKLGRFIRTQGSIVHLPNQHFARYALFLNRPFIVTVHDLARCCFNFDPRIGTSEVIGMKQGTRTAKCTAVAGALFNTGEGK